MRRSAEEIIREYIDNGYEKVADSADATVIERLRVEYKSNGFDARWWTIKDIKLGNYHVLYAKKRAPRTKRVNTTPDYKSMTVKDLRSLCSERKIPKYYKMNKDEMIRALIA